MSIPSGSIASALLVAIVTLCSIVAAPTGAQTRSAPLVSEARLGPVPDNPACISRSADGLHVATVANRNNHFVVVHDGVEGPSSTR